MPRRPLTRRDLDVRLGYTGLGVGALTFVLVLVASFVVTEVAPRVDLPDVLARQSVVHYPALDSVPGERVDHPTRARAEQAGPDRPTQNPATVAPAPEEAGDMAADHGDHGGWDGSGGGGTPGEPGAPVADGPVSQAVDPAVNGLTGAVDAATSGATSPVTGSAGALTDDVTDLGDALLGQP